MCQPGGPTRLGCSEVTVGSGDLGEAVKEGWANRSVVCSADWARTSRVRISGCQHEGGIYSPLSLPQCHLCHQQTPSALLKTGLLVLSWGYRRGAVGSVFCACFEESLCWKWQVSNKFLCSIEVVFAFLKKKKKRANGLHERRKELFPNEFWCTNISLISCICCKRRRTVSAYSLLPHINTITGLHERIITTSEDYTPFFSCRCPRRPVCHLRLPPRLLFLLLCLSLPWVT